ncbi:bifunctional hydroxymethylpyrimidine kinase/phosphomethylpyrimidine kinase [Rhizobium halophytocola]|uniref:hydroxymethylpyrimidine kinase n=1 Tax=Rhizobium halophytocola TaxID=735519 RepID=A0ABS4E0L4_9HYPH|nr:bifunctional hydroxymethylpyrimidine kinase/phosphomethylpyrimidine kinase [Rhizobium halophytocola]MBP1851449.1 hydroxymethylpyrimidine/phosphomethylpyrimidine kinase [Rhizobium halophytocola]
MTGENPHCLRPIRNLLSIAGSDPSGGAGIQADLKSFSARGVFGMAAMTALTAQNTRGVTAVHRLPPDFVRAQVEAVFADIRVDAVKIGMLAEAGIVEAVASTLRRHREVPVVLDPVMVAKGGTSLLDAAAVVALKTQLVPLARLITPNLPEAAALLGRAEARSREEMLEQARRLLALGPEAVLVKGGHLTGDDSPDLLVTTGEAHWFEGERIVTANTHGTGCSLSSAIAAELAKGAPMRDAVAIAKHWLVGAIATAGQLSVGAGHGPVHHFHGLWPEGNA